MKWRKEWGQLVRIWVEIIGILLLFYRNVLWILAFAVPLFLFRYQAWKKEQKEQRKWRINLEFKEGLQGIAAALNAGYSIENALAESKKDLEVLYGEDCILCQEFDVMLAQMHLNQTMENVLEEFALRSGVEDVRSFAEIFRTARRSGGDLVSITRTSATRIGEKIEVTREIRSLIAGKQLEGHIMNFVPLGMILYFWICSPGFLDCLYNGIWGHIIMTILLAIYLLSYEMSKNICQIRM